jgi:peroxiredoxin
MRFVELSFRENRMRTTITALIVTLVSLASTATVSAETAVVGKPAPDFKLSDAQGKDTSLSQFKGKTVVLEWYNPTCPFVKKFYANGNMQQFQKEAVAKGAVWLTINSNAEGKPGHLAQGDAAQAAKAASLNSTALLLDPKGTVGREYGARTTPHMFVVDPKGTLAYAGAIDDTPSTSSGDIESAENHVMSAIDAIAQGKAVDPASTEPYGCSVKY